MRDIKTTRECKRTPTHTRVFALVSSSINTAHFVLGAVRAARLRFIALSVSQSAHKTLNQYHHPLHNLKDFHTSRKGSKKQYICE